MDSASLSAFFSTASSANAEISATSVGSSASVTNDCDLASVVDLDDSRKNATKSVEQLSTKLADIQRKIDGKIPLGWCELFLLKSTHCAFVVEREEALRQLKLRAISASGGGGKGTAFGDAEAPLRHALEIEILANYRRYQSQLEKCRAVPDCLRTKLALLILRAETYWYAARVTSDVTLRNCFYAVARRRYAELLALAEQCLTPDDRSRLTLVEKMSKILVESTVFCSDVLYTAAGLSCRGEGLFAEEAELGALVEKCRLAVGEAERKLASIAEVDVKKERKMIRIKNNLLRVETTVQFYAGSGKSST